MEGLVAQTLRAYRDYRGICDEIYYWSTAGSSRIEVDFLLVSGHEVVAVEAKTGKNFTESWCKGLRAISQAKPIKRRIVVYPAGPVLRTRDGIDVLPFDRFSQTLAQNTL